MELGCQNSILVLHVLVILVHRAGLARGRMGLGQDDTVVIDLGAVDAFLKDGFGFIKLELGLEVDEVVGVAAAVGATTGVGELELLVYNLLTSSAPIALAAAVLFGLLRIHSLEAVLGKKLGDVLLWKDSALSDAGVILVVELVGTSHSDGYEFDGAVVDDSSQWQ